MFCFDRFQIDFNTVRIVLCPINMREELLRSWQFLFAFSLCSKLAAFDFCINISNPISMVRAASSLGEDSVAPSIFSISMQLKSPIFNDATTGKRALQAAWDMYAPSLALGKVTLSPSKKAVKLFFYDCEPGLEAISGFGKQFLKASFAGAEKLDDTVAQKVVQDGKRHRERQENLESQFSSGMLNITQHLASMMAQRQPRHRNAAQESALHEYAAGVNQVFSKKIKISGRNLCDIVDEKCNQDGEDSEDADEEDNVSAEQSEAPVDRASLTSEASQL